MGQWKSAAFIKYLDEAFCFLSSASPHMPSPLVKAGINEEAAFEVSVESDGEEWIDSSSILVASAASCD